jgi:choline dehydrogenase-like flavoprotein
MMRLLLIVLEWVFPLLLVGRPIPFSALGARSRRVLVERLIRPPGWWPRMVTLGVRSMPRALKVLTCAGYYGDPLTMRAVGFVEFEGSPRSRGVDLTPKRYPDPHRNGRVAGAGTGADARAVVIGSGASGSVMAYELARRGLEVTVLERGRHEDPQTFEHDEAAMFARLYKHGGLQTAADNNTAIFQGCTVGGSTVINNAIWLRPPDLPRVLGEWERAGAQVPEPDLLAAYAELEAALHVGQIDKRVANPGTDVFLAGCAATPQTTGVLLENNRDRCTGCGWCNYGCRYNRKTSMLVTYVPWAQDLGVELLDQVLDVRIERNGAGRVVGVQATRDGQRISLQAEKVIVCAGAIGSSALLLENGITAGGNVGKHLHALGGVFVTGDMGQVIDGFAGIGLTCMAETAEDYRMESYFAPPLAFSVRVGGWLLSHFERVERYRHFIDGGVMVGTDPTHSSVSLSRGKVKIQLVPSARDIGLLKRGLTRMSEIYFAAGARRVYPSTFKYIDLLPSTYAEVIEQRINGMDDILFGSAHPQGGNVMSGDPAKGVVDEGFQVHGVEGLYVADTSVWPTNIRANCQATAMAMAHYAAGLIAPGARPSPAPQQAPLQASQQTPQQTPQPSHQAGGAA